MKEIYLVHDGDNYPIACFKHLKDAEKYMEKECEEGYCWISGRILFDSLKEHEENLGDF